MSLDHHNGKQVANFQLEDEQLLRVVFTDGSVIRVESTTEDDLAMLEGSMLLKVEDDSLYFGHSRTDDQGNALPPLVTCVLGVQKATGGDLTGEDG